MPQNHFLCSRYEGQDDDHAGQQGKETRLGDGRQAMKLAPGRIYFDAAKTLHVQVVDLAVAVEITIASTLSGFDVFSSL